MFWGRTPAIDFCEELAKITKEPLSYRSLHFLVIGGADARHLLRTLSRIWKYGLKEPVVITIFEPRVELLARQLLLLSIALEPNQVLRPSAKTRFFMELYGNMLVRPAVEKYMIEKANDLTEFITQDTTASSTDKLSSLVDISGLRYKERDYLETLFRFWSGRLSSVWDGTALWDRRIREHLGTRYDSRTGVFDWDLHMRLHEIGGERVSSKEYKHWRGTGVAFTWLHTEPTRPNRTLAAGIMPVSSTRTIHAGYLGDITIGPYAAYGLDSDNKELLEKRNNIYTHSATDITEYNLMQMFYELLEGQEYCAAGDIVEVVDVAERSGILSNVRIEMLSCSGSLERFVGSCDVVWISRLAYERGPLEAVNTLKSGGLLLAEGLRLDLKARKDQFDQCEQQMRDIASLPSKVALTSLPFDASKDWCAKFVSKLPTK